MHIEYKTNIEDAVDCHIRFYNKTTSAKKSRIFSFFITPAFLAVFFSLKSNDILHVSLVVTFCLIFYYALIIYLYGPGHRRKVKKQLKESMTGSPWPTLFKCDIDESGIQTDSGVNQIGFPWSSIVSIEDSQKYIEITATGGFLQLKKEHSPPIEEIQQIKNSACST